MEKTKRKEGHYWMTQNGIEKVGYWDGQYWYFIDLISPFYEDNAGDVEINETPITR